MNKKHLRGVDLNLLPVLEALLRHRNATHAGAEIGLTQPAMSRALARLRHLLDDPLLMRGSKGYALTPRAQTLRQPLSDLLARVRDLLEEPPFDPAAEARTLSLAMTDAQASLLLPRLVARVSTQAPSVTIKLVPLGPDSPARVASGEVDLGIALDATPLPPGAVSEPLAEDRLTVAVRRGHPAAVTGWQLDDYARYPSVAIALLGDGTSDLDAELARRGGTPPDRQRGPELLGCA